MIQKFLDSSRDLFVFDKAIKYSFRCECYSNYEWISNDINDSGGTCELKTPSCEDIICITGACVLNENTASCKLELILY